MPNRNMYTDPNVDPNTEANADKNREVFNLDWVNIPSVKDLAQCKSNGEPDQQAHVTELQHWKDNLYIEGKAKVKSKAGRSKTVPKVIRKQAEWRYTSLTDPFLSAEDMFDVLPRTAGDKNRAEQNKLMLNYQFNNQIDKVKFIDDYVRDLVDLGTVIVKVGWSTKEETIQKEIPVYEYIPSDDPALAQKYMLLLQLIAQDPERYADMSTPGLDKALQLFAQTQQVVIPQQVGTETIEVTVETENKPTVEVVDQENLYIDPTCNGVLENAQFVCQVEKSSISELKKTGMFKNLNNILQIATNPLEDADFVESPDNTSFSFEDDPRKEMTLITYWGTWDINGDDIAEPIVASWINNTFIRLERNPYPDRQHPFVSAVYMPKRRSIFGEPDGALIEDNQKIIGATTRGIIDLLGKSANSQRAYRQGTLDIRNKKLFDAGEDFEVRNSENITDALYTFTYPEVPNSAYNLITFMQNEVESLTGVKAYNSGISGNALGNVATGVRSVLDAASKRELGILRRAASGMVKIGRKIISMNTEFLSEEETVRVTADEFVQVRRDNMGGEIDLRLTITTAEEDNKKAEELSFILQTIGPNMDLNMTKLILANITKLRKMPQLTKMIENFEPAPPDPLDQQLKILEMEYKIALVMKERSLAGKHDSTAAVEQARAFKEAMQGELNKAKIGTEMSKAKDLSSTADLKDLDFIEQESGVKQLRDIEKIDRTGTHNMAASILAAQLNKNKEQ